MKGDILHNPSGEGGWGGTDGISLGCCDAGPRGGKQLFSSPQMVGGTKFVRGGKIERTEKEKQMYVWIKKICLGPTNS